MLRFAIVGKMRSGKSTVAKLLGLELKEFYKIEFSDALKMVTNILYPNTKKFKNREKLIEVGQHIRKLDKDVWVNIVEEQINKVEESNGVNFPIIVSSVRQPNEVEMLKRRGFIFIKVESDEDIRIQRCINSGDSFSKKTFTDYTETALDNLQFDYVINNNKDFNYLKKCVSYIVAAERCKAEDFIKVLEEIEDWIKEDI